MEAGEFRSLEALGEAEGVSGRRISQILRLLHLEPEIIVAVEVPADQVPQGVTERRLREVSKLVGREEQLAAWEALVSSSSSSLASGVPMGILYSVRGDFIPCPLAARSR